MTARDTNSPPSRPGSRNRGRGVPSDLIQSVQRAFRLLEVVGASPHGLTVKEMSRRAELALGTTYHLVSTMHWEGWLVRADDGRFHIGLAVSDRYQDLLRALAGPATVEEALRRAAAETGYSHFFGRIVDGRPAVVAVAEGPRSPRVEDLIVGFDEGAHAHALGKALLATMTGLERRDYLKQAGMRRYTGDTLVDPEELDRDLRQRAAWGVYTEINQFRDGVGCAGAVVRDEGNPKDRAVIACTMPLRQLGRDGARVHRRLQRAAEELQALA